MINFFRKFFIRKQHVFCMELHVPIQTYLSLKIPSTTAIEGFREFFYDNHFLIAHNIFDPKLSKDVKLQEIYKKLSLVYNFNLIDDNLKIVYGKKKVYLSQKGYYVTVPSGGIFLYDKTKVTPIL